MRSHAITILLSAFLLFQVQPLIAKIILPWFGGSAAVWSAALLFFQVLLLMGYAYAHLSIRYLGPRAQGILHCALLIVSSALLPILPATPANSAVTGDPTIAILLTLGASVGLPFFLLSTTSPLLQAWYVRSSGSTMPYRLFALSNLGSLLALLSFPFLVEPLLSSREQAYAWSGGYLVFAALCLFTAWSGRAGVTTGTGDVGMAPHPDRAPRVRQLVLWVLLAACPTVLLMAVTNHTTRNVAPIPFLWVLPLALYLLSFVFTFESDRFYVRSIFVMILPLALGGMVHLIHADPDDLSIAWLLPGFAIGFFICCMVCHGELARLRPSARHLTVFYLMIALGGALGGCFVALIAPRLFSGYAELPVALVACGVLTLIAIWRAVPGARANVTRIGGVLVVLLLAGRAFQLERSGNEDVIFKARSFYGTLSVQDDPPTGPFPVRRLLNGNIEHGSELRDTAIRSAASYYGEFSGVGRALRALKAKGPLRVGVIGLGAGVLAHYGRSGDHFSYFEIDPLSVKIARSHFSFYSNSQADQRIILGDARLSLDAMDDQHYDLLAVDAFSGDAVPVHLLTREAVDLYVRHLKPDGVLAFHISNRYLDLEPVCAANANAVGRQARVIYDDACTAPWYSPSTWVLITADTTIYSDRAFHATVVALPEPGAELSPDREAGKPVAAHMPSDFRQWTDDHSNLFQVMVFPP